MYSIFWPYVHMYMYIVYAGIYFIINTGSVSGQLLETFRLLIKSQLMFIAQTFDLHYLIVCCLVSLETEFQFRNAFRCKMTAKILEHVIGELLDNETNYRTALLSCAFLRTNY